MEWPPDFSFELDRRLKLEHRLTAEPDLLGGALLRYAQDPAAFISDCVYIYEPRNANTGEPVMLPVVLGSRKEILVDRGSPLCYLRSTTNGSRCRRASTMRPSS